MGNPDSNFPHGALDFSPSRAVQFTRDPGFGVDQEITKRCIVYIVTPVGIGIRDNSVQVPMRDVVLNELAHIPVQYVGTGPRGIKVAAVDHDMARAVRKKLGYIIGKHLGLDKVEQHVK